MLTRLDFIHRNYVARMKSGFVFHLLRFRSAVSSTMSCSSSVSFASSVRAVRSSTARLSRRIAVARSKAHDAAHRVVDALRRLRAGLDIVERRRAGHVQEARLGLRIGDIAQGPRPCRSARPCRARCWWPWRCRRRRRSTARRTPASRPRARPAAPRSCSSARRGSSGNALRWAAARCSRARRCRAECR